LEKNKLKTLKDLEGKIGVDFWIKEMHIEDGRRIIDKLEIKDPKRFLKMSLVDAYNLRQVVIEWIKDFRKNKDAEEVVLWIKVFFNIEESELKC